MGRWQRLLTAATAACALVCVLPSHAPASSTQETVLQDDSLLIYTSPVQVQHALRAIKDLGVDRVRVSVVWSLVAPDPNSAREPNFDATDPNAYPPGAWDRYDGIVQQAKAAGVQVYFQLTAPAPEWATPPRALPQGYRWSHDPSAKAFGQFAEAVGRRYRGIVHYWGIWNEPNIGGWMTPQWRTLRHRHKVQASPAIYRGMVDAAWRGLQDSGHRGDTILIGETGAYGFPWKGYGADMSPLTFLRAFYCVSSSYRPLRGRSARQIGCPGSGSRAAFVAAHPGLFHATGWAHHPYDFKHPPATHLRDPGAADLADLSRIERVLNRVRAAYGKHSRMPLYLTEWGYQSNPPDPFVKFSLAQQAEYLNQGEYMAWRDPRVRAFGQFLLVDSPPFTQYSTGSRAYWSSFQSGLINPNGTLKPAFGAFRIPIWLPHPHHGTRVAVWGQLRPGDHNQLQRAQLQFRPAGSQVWTTIASVQTRDTEGFFLTHVGLPSAGLVKLVFADPGTGATDESREAAVR